MDAAGIVRTFTTKFPDIDVKTINEHHIEFTVGKDIIRDVITLVDETFPEVIPESAFGVDLGDDKYQVNYMFWSHKDRMIIQLKVNLEGSNPSLPACCDIFSGLEWHERETHEMFGIMFTGHPDLRPLLLPDELVGKYPMRKSFQTDRSRQAETGLPVRKPRPEGGAKK